MSTCDAHNVNEDGKFKAYCLLYRSKTSSLNLNKESVLIMSKLTNLAVRSHAIHSTHPSILEFKHIVLEYGCQSTEHICLWKNL